MKILLVGGSGFLGAWVARFLHINQCLARIFDPNKPDSEWHRLSGIRADATDWVAGNVSKKSELDDAIRDCKGVINLAGLLTPECSQNPVRGAEVNLIGAINVFEGALKHGLKKVAYTSSIGVYGPDPLNFLNRQPITAASNWLLREWLVHFMRNTGFHPWESDPLWFMVLEGKLEGAPGRP